MLKEENCYKINKFEINSNVKYINENFLLSDKSDLETNPYYVKIAGRVMRIRNFGKILFICLRTFDGDIQIVFQNKKTITNNINLGDIIGVEGVIFKTNKDELSVKVEKYLLLSKCLKTLPDLYYGFKDIEDRFRKRHVDFIINNENRDLLIKRSKIIKTIRNFLDNKSFIEVETPILVPEASGAQAKPFITHYNKLGFDFNLRIATEIPLKKLIVSGFEKIYEIGKVFRNEGIDARHNPEFTTIEIYESYKDSFHMMEMTELLIKEVSMNFKDKDGFLNFGSERIDLTSIFPRITMTESIFKFSGVDFSKIKTFKEAKEIADRENLKVDIYQNTVGHIMNIFFEKFVEKNLINPTFIYNYPIENSPLAKTISDNNLIADRFELFIGGLEFANGYSELNDPEEQKLRFKNQAKEKVLGNDEIAGFDTDFIDTLFYGMPPTGGLGIGIDRVIMLMTNKLNIREIIAFPQMKKSK